MIKLKLTHCKICNKHYNARGFSQHIKKSHDVELLDYIVKYEFDGIHPTCKCGCGKHVTIRSNNVMEYINGHCDSGQFKNGIVKTKDKEKWLTNLKVSIKKYNDDSKLNDPNYRRGTNNNFYGRHHSEETKKLIRNAVEIQIENGNHPFIGNDNGRIGTSSLEKKFEDHLIEKNIKYIHNFKIGYLPTGKTNLRYKYFDFYIPESNKLIELHGTYWHPTELNDKSSKIQINNYYNDLFKIELAKTNGYVLDIIYDTDIDNYIQTYY